jgi:hypothetical protein
MFLPPGIAIEFSHVRTLSLMRCVCIGSMGVVTEVGALSDVAEGFRQECALGLHQSPQIVPHRTGHTACFAG